VYGFQGFSRLFIDRTADMVANYYAVIARCKLVTSDKRYPVADLPLATYPPKSKTRCLYCR